jgi:hypothetical protein
MCSREVVCFEWYTNWILKYYLERNDRLYGLVVRVPDYRGPDYRGPGYDSRRCQIFWEVLGLERGPLSLVRTTEELLGRKSWRLRSRKPRIRPWGSVTLPRGTLYPQKLVVISPTNGGRSVGIVRSLTHAMEYVFPDDRWECCVLSDITP